MAILDLSPSRSKALIGGTLANQSTTLALPLEDLAAFRKLELFEHYRRSEACRPWYHGKVLPNFYFVHGH